VLEGETGFSVDGKSATAIAAAAVHLLNNPDFASTLGSQGRQWIVDQWRWEIWANVFKKLLLK
jgi:phosphatidylinositol alpha-1,6-mannosyltransferase